jgi:hypothetical protein
MGQPRTRRPSTTSTALKPSLVGSPEYREIASWRVVPII